MQTPVIQSERLLLRPFQSNDAQDVFDCWESDPEVARYMFWTSHNDINKTKEWIAFELEQINKDDWYRYAIIEKESGGLIGTGLIYYESEVSSWEIGYNLGQRYWNHGYATEALQAIISFAQDNLGIKEIVGRHAKENIASENIMKKLGFLYEKDIPYECNNGTVLTEGKMYRLNL